MTHQTATIDDTVYFWFASNDTSGSGGDGATPLYDVREAGAAASAIPLLSGTPTLLTHANYPAGCHEIAVAATTGNGFAADDTFAVFCTLAIDAQNPSGFVGSCTLTPLAKAAALATAQTDLDTITGSDGVTLATAQALYAPSKAGDAMSLTATGLDAIVSTATGMVEIAKAVWDRIISKTNHNIGQSAGKILRQSGDLVQIDGAVSDVSPTTTDFDTNLTQVDGYFEDALLIFSAGAANEGIGIPVSTYLNVNGNMTFAAPDIWPVTPVNGDDFIIYANHVHPIAQIADGIWDELLSGHTTAGTTGKAVSDIEGYTDDIGVAGAGLTDLGGMSTGMKAEVNAEADTALTDYDGPTNAEMEARTPTAAQLLYITRHAATALPVTFTGGTTTTAILGNVDGSAASTTDDVYNSRLLVFNAGTLDVQVCQITDYVGSTKTATITAVTTAVTSGHTAVLV